MNDRMISPHFCRLFGVAFAALGACVPAKLELFDSGTTDAGGTSTTTTSSATATASAGTGDALTTTAMTPGWPGCAGPDGDCSEDLDRDGHDFVCDNAPAHFNPDQSDLDDDGIGDVSDLCPTIPNADLATADADRDGIGNACDLCPKGAYNYDGIEIPAYMRVRNIPQVEDSDQDGVGDACDNCVRTPNCQGYGDGLDPYTLGESIDYDAADCQVDLDLDQIGDDCAGTMMPGAAGPVGFGPEDDFDQDGLANLGDLCPRQPVAFQACDGPEDCPESGVCTAGVCNHRDIDLDGVGDICDSCPFAPNPNQILEGLAEEDDLDGDFVGNACETDSACTTFSDPRAFGFYDKSSGGYCCVRLAASGTAVDPYGDTVPLTSKVLERPGVGVLPPGCTEEAEPLDPAIGLEALWAGFCLLPQWDQDLDGIGDVCDLCTYAFDPNNEIYVDENNTEWEHFGKYCEGQFAPENLDQTKNCTLGH